MADVIDQENVRAGLWLHRRVPIAVPCRRCPPSGLAVHSFWIAREDCVRLWATKHCRAFSCPADKGHQRPTCLEFRARYRPVAAYSGELEPEELQAVEHEAAHVV